MWVRLGGKCVYIALNFGHFASYIPKIIKFGGNLTKFWKKQKFSFFLSHGVYYCHVMNCKVLPSFVRMLSCGIWQNQLSHITVKHVIFNISHMISKGLIACWHLDPIISLPHLVGFSAERLTLYSCLLDIITNFLNSIQTCYWSVIVDFCSWNCHLNIEITLYSLYG